MSKHKWEKKKVHLKWKRYKKNKTDNAYIVPKNDIDNRGWIKRCPGIHIIRTGNNMEEK